MRKGHSTCQGSPGLQAEKHCSRDDAGCPKSCLLPCASIFNSKISRRLNTCNSSMREAEAGELQSQGHSGLHRDRQSNLGSEVMPCLKTRQNTTNEPTNQPNIERAQGHQNGAAKAKASSQSRDTLVSYHRGQPSGS